MTIVENGNVRAYALVKEDRRNEDHVSYTAYGIDYHGANGVQAYISDVSSEESLVSKMVELFNLCELPPERLKSAVLALLP